MTAIKTLIHDFSRLFFPHRCAGCGGDTINKESPVCIRCLHQVPLTNFHLYAGNPVEKHFAGTLPLVSGASYCYFTKHAIVQQLLHAFKYRGNKETGYFYGRLMGKMLMDSGRFDGIDALVPMPLHPARERKRGYNQALLLCEGMSQALSLPIITGAVKCRRETGSQTHKTGIERWQNMQELFQLAGPDVIAGKHLLLVDDVITTGSTLNACGRVLLQAPGVRLSIVTLAYAGN